MLKFPDRSISMMPNAIDRYIAPFPPVVQERLEILRSAIQKAAPHSTEVISYGMPAFKAEKVLVYFAAHKNHIGFYPTSSGIQAFKQDLAGFEHSKGAVQFPFDRPLPLELVTRIVKYRMSEVLIGQYLKKGYAIARKFFNADEVAEIAAASDQIKAEGLKHDRSFRHQNLLYLIQQDPKVGKVLRFCQWPAYSNPVIAKYRTDRRFFDLFQPLLGQNIKQITNQLIWKTPGASSTSFGFHQDARFRRPASAYRDIGESFVQAALAMDPHTEDNGCLVVIEGSHLRGDLHHFTPKSIFEEEMSFEILKGLGLGRLKRVKVLLEPGDLAFWHPYALHGSGPNLSGIDRRSFVNGFVKAENCDRGEWAFREGQPVELGDPVLVQYEDLYTRPEPHYIEGPPHPLKSSHE